VFHITPGKIELSSLMYAILSARITPSQCWTIGDAIIVNSSIRRQPSVMVVKILEIIIMAIDDVLKSSHLRGIFKVDTLAKIRLTEE
jgi:hypothetical protein